MGEQSEKEEEEKEGEVEKSWTRRSARLRRLASGRRTRLPGTFSSPPAPRPPTLWRMKTSPGRPPRARCCRAHAAVRARRLRTFEPHTGDSWWGEKKQMKKSINKHRKSCRLCRRFSRRPRRLRRRPRRSVVVVVFAQSSSSSSSSFHNPHGIYPVRTVRTNCSPRVCLHIYVTRVSPHA